MKQYGKIIALGLVVVAAAIVMVMIRAEKQQPQLPSLSPRSGGGSASSEYVNAQKAVDHYRNLIAKNPDIIKNYIELAQVFLQEGREAGNNSEYIPKAEYLLNEALERDPANADAIITKASIAAILHRFADAKQLADEAIAKNPHPSFNYGVLTDALVELGQYDEAVKTCDKMLSIRPDIRSYSRASYLRELHGDVNGAIEAMKMAADAGVSGQENRAWVLYNLGMLYLNEGKTDTAHFIFSGILEERPGYAHALSGLADVHAVTKEYNEAVRYYELALKELNEPGFHAALGDIYDAMGLTTKAEQCYMLAEEGFIEEKEMGEDNAVEMAEFFASRDRKLDEALALAQSAIERRPGIHAYETLALALYKNGMYSEASSAIEKAMRLETRDAKMFYLAGMIAHKSGDAAGAKTNLAKALSINANFSLIEAADAKKVLERYQKIG